MKNRISFVSIAIIILSFSLLSQSAYGQLAVHPTNPRYFTNGSGDAIYLTGSHTWYLIHTSADDMSPDNSYQDMTDYLDFMQSHGHNFVRLWTGWSIGSGPFPWQRPGPGTASDGLPQFDMTKFSQSYFDTVEQWVQELDSRGMYCSIMFYGSGRAFETSSWSKMAWHENNNVNTELDSFSSTDGTSFFSPNSQALDIQRMTVRKFIDDLNSYDNIIWEIVNEAPIESMQWQRYMADYVISYESGKPKQHLVGITGGDSHGTELLTGNHQWLSPDLYSMGYYEGGDADYTDKIVISDTDHIRNPANDGWGYSELRFVSPMRKWVWETFARGNHPIFMDWYDDYDSDPQYGQTNINEPGEVNHDYDPVRDAMGYTLSYSNRMDLANAIPSDSSGDCSTTYCLRNPGTEYLVYQPGSGSFNVDLIAGNYDYEWFNPRTGYLEETGTVSAGDGSRSFTPPFSGDAVLYLYSSSPPQTCQDLDGYCCPSSHYCSFPLSAPGCVSSETCCESQSQCVQDPCGDNYCDAASGECDTCPQDCSVISCCGHDSGCNLAAGETCSTCPGDCGCPPGQACSSGTCQDIPPDPGTIPHGGWSLLYADSEETSGEDGAAVNAFDGDPTTYWHTQWSASSPPHPHEIQISLGGSYDIHGFRYLPRQDGDENGMIAGYEFYVSTDGSNWGTPVAQGSFTSSPNEQEATFQTVTGSFVRLVALSEVNGGPWTSAAEINVLEDPASQDTCTSLGYQCCSACSPGTEQPAYDGDCPGVCCESCYSGSTTCDSLQALYHLDGDAADSSGNNHNGTVTGASQTTGQFDQAFSFDGASDHISFGDVELATNDITISLWVRPDDLVNNQGYPISKYNVDTNEREYAVFLNGPSNRLSLLIGNSAGDGYATADIDALSPLLTNGAWSNIVFTRSGSSVECYIDGISQSFSAIDVGTNDFADTGSDMRIGERDSGGRAFAGSVDEVAIWDRALSAQEVQDIYSSGSEISCQTQPIHRADTSGDGCIDSSEILAFIDLWYQDSTEYSMIEMMEAVGLWYHGTGC